MGTSRWPRRPSVARVDPLTATRLFHHGLLEIEATRALAAGTRTLLAEVTRPDGGKSQVFAALR